MAMGIRYYAETAKTKRERDYLTYLADLGDAYREAAESMPSWAKDCPARVCTSVPLTVIAEHSENRDNIHVREFVTKRGETMTEVTWVDRYGEHRTQSTLPAGRSYYEWNNFEF